MFLMSLFLTMTGADADWQHGFQFNHLTERQYTVVNDSVMGGRSASQLSRNDQGLVFSGDVSLENNGGFASARMLWPLNDGSLKTARMMVLTVTGDGSTFQFRLRTDRGFDGAAYSQRFSTLKNTRQTVYLPLADFVPTFRGRILTGMPALNLADVQQMGVLISDKQSGPFTLTLHSLQLQ